MTGPALTQPPAQAAHFSSFKQGQRIFTTALMHHTPNLTQKTLSNNQPKTQDSPSGIGIPAETTLHSGTEGSTDTPFATGRWHLRGRPPQLRLDLQSKHCGCPSSCPCYHLEVLGPQLSSSSTLVTLPTQAQVTFLLTMCEVQTVYTALLLQQRLPECKNTNFRSQSDDQLASFSGPGPKQVTDEGTHTLQMDGREAAGSGKM